MTRPTRLIRAAPRPDAGGVEFDDDGSGISAATVAEAIAASLPVVIAQFVNKSGGSLVAGDVVIVDTGNDTAVETTTVGQSETTVGVVQASIANDATGPVLLAGMAELVNVPSSVTRGHYVQTHTVAKQAVGNATRQAGSFGQFLTGGTTPSAVLWGQTDQTASGGGSTVDIEDEGSPEGAADTIDFTGAGVSVSFSGGTATVDIPGGGGSGTSPEWWDSPNAPGGSDDEEFINNTVIGTLTRVAHGTPKGTWTESVDGLIWDQSGTPTTELDTFAVPLGGIATGDHVTLAFQVQAWENSKMGAFLGFSNGTTFGTSDAVGAFCTPSAPFIFLLNNWANFNSRATDGTVTQVTVVNGTRVAVRVHYVASNTWGVSYRLPGDRWRSVQQNYSLSLTPTHAVFGVAMNNNPGSTTTTIRLESFRYNDTSP